MRTYGIGGAQDESYERDDSHDASGCSASCQSTEQRRSAMAGTQRTSRSAPGSTFRCRYPRLRRPRVRLPGRRRPAARRQATWTLFRQSSASGTSLGDHRCDV